jgi:glycosyltransferase involved in cell wall biosynthesis
VLHVGLNLVFLVPGQTGGMEVAARETIARLRTREDLRLTLFVNREAADEPWHGLAKVVVPVRATDRVQWVLGEQLLLPLLARRAGVDVLHSPGGTAPLLGARGRRLLTLHDLNYRLVPEAHLGVRGKVMGLLVPAAVRRSARLLVDAASTREDLREHLGTPPSKVDVVPLAAAPPALAPTASAVLRARLGLADGERVVLSVSAKRPHKNLLRVVEALDGLDATLVQVGYRTDHALELERAAAGRRVVLLDHVPAADLEGLYALADVLVFPSLYEGFGLPVLEAMQRGVPVVTSRRGSLAEVAGDAALVVDPESVDAIREGVRRVLEDPALAADLAARGREQAACFSWDRTAELTAAAYARVAA